MKYLIIPFLIFLYGCVTRPMDRLPRSKLLQLPINKKDKIKKQYYKPSREQERIILFSAPNQSGKPQQQDWSSGLGVNQITMKIISQWENDTLYHMSVKFTNPSDQAINANLNLYAYDSLGRLVRSLFEGTFAFRPKSVMNREYSFSKGGEEVRWILTLTGKN